MKRHISLFAFLLGVFAAAAPVQAEDNVLSLMLNTEGIYLEGVSKTRGMLIQPVGTWNERLSSGSRSYVSSLSNGLKVVKWEYAPSKSKGPWTELGQSGTNITWTYRSDMSTVYLRPWLAWLHYSLSYDGNGGSGSMEGLADVRYDTAVKLPSCTFKRTGYSFAYWSLVKSGGTKWKAGTKCDGHDFGVDAVGHDYGKDAQGTPVKLYARWKANTYTVTFDVNAADGACDPASKTVTYSKTFGDLPAPTRPAKSGYPDMASSWRFDGWFDAQGNKIESDTKVKITEDITLSAHWTEIYKVQYVDAALFDGKVLKTEYVLAGEKATPPANPSRTGYTFQQWTGYNDFLNVRQERTYTAVYAGNQYAVIFHSDNGAGETHRQDFSYGSSQKLWKNEFVQKGHGFLGWSETAGSADVKWSDEANVTDLAMSGEVHLYAVWDANVYYVAFDANGGTGSMATMTNRYGVVTNLPPNAFTRSGLDFKRWQDDARHLDYLDGEAISNLTDKAGETVTLKAVWFEGYFVRFNGNGATSGEMADLQFACDTPTALPANAFLKKGYTFGGWTNSLESADKVYADGETVNNLAPMGETAELFAVWQPNTYYIRFDDNGANDGDMSVQAFTYDQSGTLSPNAFVRDFHKFGGWGLSPDATAWEYAPEDLICNLTDVPNETNTLYALWKDNRTDLSRAADCPNLDLLHGMGDLQNVESFSFGSFEVVQDVAYTNGTSCCAGGNLKAMNAVVPCSGHLSFKLRIDNDDFGQLAVYRNVYGDSSHKICNVRGDTEGLWVDCEADLAAGDKIAWLSMVSGGGQVSCWVDQVVWTPDSYVLRFDANGGANAPADVKIALGSRDKLPRGIPTRAGYAFAGWALAGSETAEFQPRDTFRDDQAQKDQVIALSAVWIATGDHPVPEEKDAVTISSAAVSGDTFTLSFKSDAQFDYNLLTNANLLIDSWGVMEKWVGDGSVHTFEPKVVEGQPQLFYKVETIQKKD